MQGRLGALVFVLALGVGGVWAGACWGAPAPEGEVFNLRVLREGELAWIRLVGGALLVDSPAGARTYRLTPEERQRLLVAVTTVLKGGNGPRTCEDEEAYVHLRMGEREASWTLCRGGRSLEAPWRRLLEIVRQSTGGRGDGGA
ncbi:MAG TPA: hypothetical protein VH877_18745 [Polyangia bacterium]|jgi:hypothetical protein|nr:hypothetical protein [Polyangia bacterium]